MDKEVKQDIISLLSRVMDETDELKKPRFIKDTGGKIVGIIPQTETDTRIYILASVLMEIVRDIEEKP